MNGMGMYSQPLFRLAGDRGLLVEYGEAIDASINRRVRAMFMALTELRPPGLIEVVPTYRSLLMLYDPQATHPRKLTEAVLSMESRLPEIQLPPPETVEIPVCYGGEFGPDLEFVGRFHGLEVEEAIDIHSQPTYLIYMIGFNPGFPFLGGLPEILWTPRLETPRTLVPAGSVGIANEQTGIYPLDSPGGWRLIGRTPLRLFMPERDRPFLYKAGDFIRFRPISAEEYRRLRETMEADGGL